MSYAVISGTSPSHRSLREVTEPNHRRYCELHGYQYFHMDFTDGTSSWDKPAAIRRVLRANPDIHGALWLDADAIFTDNRSLHAVTCGIPAVVMLTADIHGPNCGVMYFVNSPTADELLYAVSEAGRRIFAAAPIWSDQMAFRFFLSAPPYHDAVAYLPQRAMNAYLVDLYPDVPLTQWHAGWQPGDYILHLPGLPNETRIEVLKTRCAVYLR